MTSAISFLALLVAWGELLPDPVPQESDPIPGYGTIVRRAGARDAWLGLELGTGLGMAVSDARDVRAGYARFGHLAPELGVHFGESGRFGVSIWARIQLERPIGEPIVAAMLRLLAFEREPGECGSALTRWYSYAGVGAGSILLSREYSSSAESTRSGPLLLGLGGGVTRNLSPRLGLVAEVGVLAGAPDVSVAFELSLGVQFSRPKNTLVTPEAACLASTEPLLTGS